MTEDRDFLIEPLRELVRVFDELQIPYALMGGMAVAIHGIPRPTHDLDFTVSLSRDRLHDFYSTVERLGYTLPDAMRTGWVDNVSGMPLIRVQQWAAGRNIDVDLFLAESKYQETLLTRHQRVIVEGIEAWVVSPEDLIILKLIAGRPRDIGDILDILMAQGSLDASYLRHWSEHFGLTERLDETLKLYGELN